MARATSIALLDPSRGVSTGHVLRRHRRSGVHGHLQLRAGRALSDGRPYIEPLDADGGMNVRILRLIATVIDHRGRPAGRRPGPPADRDSSGVDCLAAVPTRG